MTKDEALRLALESLKELVVDPQCDFGPSYELQKERQKKAITAIKQALEQPEPEPVAWLDADGDLYKKLPSDDWHPPHTPLYTSPPKRGPLTDEWIERFWLDYPTPIKFARAIEAAHGIKGEA